MLVELERANIKGIGIVTGSVEWSFFAHNADTPEIVMIDLENEEGEEINSATIYNDEGLLKSLETHTFGMIDEKDLKTARNPLENAHDFVYLVSANIQWLESFLALSEKRIDNNDFHNEVREVIGKLKKAFGEQNLNSKRDVQEAFEWIGKNIWKCWC